MVNLLFSIQGPVLVSVTGETHQYPVGRIFCVGRNYVAHAAEMGNEVDREAPFYFTKSSVNSVTSPTQIAYPQGTSDFHHEIELAVFLDKPVVAEDPLASVYGYGCALDMTRRDLQIRERKKQRPWDLGKDLEAGSVFGPITKSADWAGPDNSAIWLDVNGTRRQNATLDEMVWSIPEILVHLSGFYKLRAGDVIMTGTPAGVGPVGAGDQLDGGITGLQPIQLSISS